ncbi:Acb2/Tad1 domain-containing protein [Bradyrhizobium sp. 5.13L]
MTNQGLPVAGYQPQSDANVSAVNVNKRLEEEILRRIDTLEQTPGIDRRWLNIGKTHLEQAFMALNRAIFQPSRINL